MDSFKSTDYLFGIIKMKNFRAYLKNLIYTKCEPDDLPPRLSPQHMPGKKKLLAFLYKTIKILEIPPLKKNADFSRKMENFDADAFGGFSGKNIIM
jgi:hypothetical protein